MVLGIILLAGITAFGVPGVIETFTGIESVGLGTCLALVPTWFVIKGEVKTFKELTDEEIEKMEVEELAEYLKAKHESSQNKMMELIKEGNDESKAIAEKMRLEIEELKTNQIKVLHEAMEKQGVVIAELKENGIEKDSETFADHLKKAWDDNLEELKGLQKGETIGFEVSKAEQTYGDINAGLDFAQFKPGITDIPVRKPIFRSLFPVIPLSTEFLKYAEQDTVVRDAQNVAKCSPVTSTTKETIIVRSIETKVIQDEIDFCTMFIADYPFMQSRVNKLLNESIMLRADQQLLLGTGAGEETFSINSVSSDFSAANPACVLTTSIQAPNLVDLISGMATQIFELGQQNGYIPTVAVVNNCDWFKDVASLKDLNNNYLDARVVVQGGETFIVTLAGMLKVVTSPLVPQNTCYVFDNMKGEVIDRQEVRIDISFENKDNFVNHIATMLGYERINFLVENNNANAFMRCLDIGVALTAITKP